LNNFQKQIYMRQHFAVTESESEVHPSPATRAFSAPSRAGRPTKVKPLVPHGQVRGEMDAPVAACHMPHPFTEHIITIINLHPKERKEEKKGSNQGAQTA